MWIKSLRLEDFQSYKDETIDFHPHYNCLVGTGNSGKSAVVRALSFILFGTWDSSWVRHGASVCRITIVTNTGIEVVREKGTKVNKYVVRVNGTEQVYENFGVRVPEEIESVLRVFKAQVGDKQELNLTISNQLDQMFLLSESGSFKAKVFGKLSKAHYLDYTLRELNRDKKRLSTEKNVLEKEQQALEEDLKSYETLDKRKEKLDNIGERLKSLQDESSKIDKLKSLSEKASYWKSQYIDASAKVSRLSKVDFTRYESLQKGIERHKELQRLFEAVSKYKNTLKDTQNKVFNLTADIQQQTTKYVDLLKANNQCPTCFNDIDAPVLDKILETIK